MLTRRRPNTQWAKLFHASIGCAETHIEDADCAHGQTHETAATSNEVAATTMAGRWTMISSTPYQIPARPHLRALFDGRRRVVADPLADLIGDYSLKPGGEPTYRVSKGAQGYVIAARTAAGWGTPLPVAAFTESERAEAAAKGMGQT